MPALAPALADRARRLRARGRRIADVAAELGISEYQVKRATREGFADRERERWRRQDAERAARRAADPAYKAYKDSYYQVTKGQRIEDAAALAEALKERRRQRGEDQAAAAAAFGVTLPVYQAWEAGRCPRTQIRLVTLALRGLEMPIPRAGRSS